MPGWRIGADLPRHVAVGRLDLDDVGAVSPSIWVAYGPISTVVRSMTLMPFSGPMAEFAPGCLLPA